MASLLLEATDLAITRFVSDWGVRVSGVALALGTRCLLGRSTQRLSVLIFHRVLPQLDPFLPDEPDAERFTYLMTMLAAQFTPLSLSEGLRRLGDGRLPPRAVCVTFDDGYADNLLVAAPILRRVGIPATVFVASGYLDGRVMWNDRVIESVRCALGDHMDLSDFGYGVHPLGNAAERVSLIHQLLGSWKYLPFDEREQLTAEVANRYAPSMPTLMLSRSQVRQLRDEGIEIGGHTVTHPILARTDAATARREVADNKEDLEGLIGERLRFFAYPNGVPGRDFIDEHAGMVRRVGYQAALTTQAGVSTAATDRFRMPRFTPWDRTPFRFSMRLVLNMRHAV